MQKKQGYLEKLRSKPLSYRRSFALAVSLCVTLIIGAFWLVATVSNITSSDNLAGVSQTASSSLSAFSVIKDRFSELFGGNSAVINTDYSTTTNTDQNLVQ